MHCLGVCPYADSLVGTSAAMRQVAEQTDRVCFFVEPLKDVRPINGVYEVLVSLKSLSSSGYTWEPLEIMYESSLSWFAIFCSQNGTLGL